VASAAAKHWHRSYANVGFGQALEKVRSCAAFSDAAPRTLRGARLAGVRDAPRHEIAGSGASAVRAERYGDSSAGSVLMLVFCGHEGSCRAGPMLPIWVCEAARRGSTDHNRPLLGA
jgi:hypothetical protein